MLTVPALASFFVSTGVCIESFNDQLFEHPQIWIIFNQAYLHHIYFDATFHKVANYVSRTGLAKSIGSISRLAFNARIPTWLLDFFGFPEFSGDFPIRHQADSPSSTLFARYSGQSPLHRLQWLPEVIERLGPA